MTRRKRDQLRRKYNAARRAARPMTPWLNLCLIQLKDVKRICKYQKG